MAEGPRWSKKPETAIHRIHMRKNCFPPDLSFQYLPGIDFQSDEERQDILTRGLEELRKGNVSVISQQLGEKYRKKIESDFMPKVSIRWINERIGHGVFAEENLKANRFLGEYAGVVRKSIQIFFVPRNIYCFEYPVPDERDRNFVIDAEQGNFTRFINHSYKPNLKSAYAFIDGFYHLIFFSLRDIQKGEQLSFEYGPSYWLLSGSPDALE